MNTINGAILIGLRDEFRPGGFTSINPATNEPFGPKISEATDEDVAECCRLAEAAGPLFGALRPDARAAFIDTVAEMILAIDELVETAMAETGLPRARLDGERMRTVNQLRLFAEEVRVGRWLDVTIDRAVPGRTPPRPDLRRMNQALGPVAVFGASNFPLAFSVAGGDTASAFAAGCPVVAKGHPGHPATSELVARAIRSAVQGCGLPEGVFSYLPGRGNAVGTALVADPRIKAVGFTGSRIGGLAMMAIANARPQPIPVYAEMSAVNPVVLLPEALAAQAEALGAAFIDSLTLGAGQFCTNPGLLLAVGGPELDRFLAAARAAVATTDLPVMLSPGISRAYAENVAALARNPRTTQITAGIPAAGNRCSPALFVAEAADFVSDAVLGQEVFGAGSIIVRCRDVDEIAKVIAALEGQLTATLQMTEADAAAAMKLFPLLAAKAGRVLANGWPTGVEVTHAMVHGGPFPATSDGRSTSVGTLAMARFLRPVCYQDVADSFLPGALQTGNPWRLPRRIDGQSEFQA